MHKEDLAKLYLLAIEHGTDRTDYHGVAETGVRVGQIASAISHKFRAPDPIEQPVVDAVRELGSWAACHAFDQTMDAPTTRQTPDWMPGRPTILDAIVRNE